MPSSPFKRRFLLKKLVSLGVRITGPGKIIMEIIQGAHGHLDAATGLPMARKRDGHSDRATVYRTLELLRRLRLIDGLDLMHLNGEKHYYEARTNVDHVHLACVRCGRIKEFTSPLFEALMTAITRLEVGGRCKACAARNRKTKGNQERIDARVALDRSC